MDFWPACKSVALYVIPMSPETNNTYLGPYLPWDGNRDLGPVPDNIVSSEYALDRLSRLFISSVTLKGMVFLQSKGSEARYTTVQTQLKLCAYEAGKNPGLREVSPPYFRRVKPCPPSVWRARPPPGASVATRRPYGLFSPPWCGSFTCPSSDYALFQT